ncbi:xanthine dehydrogenase accessory protein XdhC [Alsobacter sp. SYSU M60028]|uniref:Xanthine dehydrogenase accessory protein XdhC n=1 Tax=Alsobacter ponti TaxID=2962936 RepID=A0ABT1L867_9HYPH|nr:xanthine dehydrogenase accessory protein XdhC [Alsobacter ponti]MCP8937696.1 xanthine dehydrogenase accessory protein XdhC [Alsobacter ponti]
MLVWSRIRETIETQGRAALASVAMVAGSAPREAGARIVLRPDGGFWGTVGGGALEHELIAEARALLAAEAAPARLRDWSLGPELGQCCGGRVATLTEVFDRRDLAEVEAWAAREAAGPFETEATLGEDGRVRRSLRTASGAVAAGPRRAGEPFVERFGEDATPVLLFGAGHVGRALALALAPLPFRVRWIDSRADAFPPLVPANAEAVLTADPEAEIAAAPSGALVMIMTHSHPLDLALATAALSRSDLPHVGLIGSATKRARFLRRMRAAGLGDAALARLACPIGVAGVVGKEPAVIAASVAVQLLQWRGLAAGVAPAEPLSARAAPGPVATLAERRARPARVARTR